MFNFNDLLIIAPAGNRTGILLDVCHGFLDGGCSATSRKPYSGAVSPFAAGETMANVRVQCYSGVKADERPVRFELDGREYLVEEILDQWYGPDDTFFKLLADDSNVYILRHSPAHDEWSLESFRKLS